MDIGETVRAIAEQFGAQGMIVIQDGEGYSAAPKGLNRGEYGPIFSVFAGSDGKEIMIERGVINHRGNSVVPDCNPIASRVYENTTEQATSAYETVVGSNGPGLQILP